jgi:hypothetical protein
LFTFHRFDESREQLVVVLEPSVGHRALVLGATALIGGFAFSARETGRRLRPNWWLDLHNWLGGSAFVFTMIHVIAVYADKAQRSA